MRAVIAAGGTGGHVFPALTLAEQLQRQGVDVHWLGTQRGLESALVPKRAIAFHLIRISGIRGRGKLALLLAPFRLLWAVWQSLRHLWRLRPDVVIGMGGFVSGPVGLAAWCLRKKLVIHEQNAIVGLTNSVLAKFATWTACAFPQAFVRQPAVVIGNPVRRALFDLPPPQQRLHTLNQRKLRLLVLGGSRGAKALNTLVPATMATPELAAQIEVWHQAGGGRQAEVAAQYSVAVRVKCSDFIEDMVQAYSWADLVICRAGALTIAELAAVGLASILIPYPFAVDDHQTANGQALVQCQAAWLLPEKEATAAEVGQRLAFILKDKSVLITMAERARAFACPDATTQLARLCLS